MRLYSYKKILLCCFLALLALFGCSKAEEKTRSGKLKLSQIGKFQTPVYATSSSSKDTYIVEQGGKIILLRGGERKVFLDIEDLVRFDGEQGLLSMALSPNWEKDRLFYVYFTNKAEKQIVAEGKSNESGSSGSLLRTVLEMDDFAANHNGGQILFGPGGLYVGTGDGGGSGDPERTALDLNSPLGKILRIDPQGGRPYAIPSGNPFQNKSGALAEIFSYGLRNPWRFSISDGRIWIGDVGQSDREEISAPTLQEARGGSFGWSRYEGRRDFNEDQSSPRTIFPVLEYKHQGGRCSVTGGYLVKNKSLPSLFGRYVYGDFCKGEIRSFLLENGKAKGDRSEGLSVPGLASFALVEKDLLAISNIGQVYRFEQRNIPEDA